MILSRLLYSKAVSPHSQLLVAAATVGGVIVLTFGLLLGGPSGLLPDRTDGETPLVRVTVIDLDSTSGAGRSTGDN